jgi:hypothetical protein
MKKRNTSPYQYDTTETRERRKNMEPDKKIIWIRRGALVAFMAGVLVLIAGIVWTGIEVYEY